ncbi:hypothetical protein EXIGLDRAFT_182771 [Exidia glandulosa HHB12029]|uniref:Uncharacterized protein n=1 Tax=Exidia glandulosa HHB12029 TaxID=1314781 RepID=A0A165F251_EXIGL|nr:hypothetical protein EXIGLDRAFT_182771 [Exidia glandulosa HHB12029]
MALVDSVGTARSRFTHRRELKALNSTRIWVKGGQVTHAQILENALLSYNGGKTDDASGGKGQGEMYGEDSTQEIAGRDRVCGDEAETRQGKMIQRERQTYPRRHSIAQEEHEHIKQRRTSPPACLPNQERTTGRAAGGGSGGGGGGGRDDENTTAK